MTQYVPTYATPPAWYTAPCQHCDAIIRSSKAHLLQRAIARHRSQHHRDLPAPEPGPELTEKTIRILAVHYSGSKRRLAGQFTALKTVVVPAAFPGDSGVAVVGDGTIRIYERLGAGVRGFTPLEW